MMCGQVVMPYEAGMQVIAAVLCSCNLLVTGCRLLSAVWSCSATGFCSLTRVAPCCFCKGGGLGLELMS